MSIVSLAGLDKAAVLAALYNASSPRGMGFIHFDPAVMTAEEAQSIIDKGRAYDKDTVYLDYLKGRIMKCKIRFDTDDFNTDGYNYELGEGTAERIINDLRESGETNPITSQVQSRIDTCAAANHVRKHLNEGLTRRDIDGTVVFELGYADVANVLGPAIDKAVS